WLWQILYGLGKQHKPWLKNAVPCDAERLFFCRSALAARQPPACCALSAVCSGSSLVSQTHSPNPAACWGSSLARMGDACRCRLNDYSESMKTDLHSLLTTCPARSFNAPANE